MTNMMDLQVAYKDRKIG